MRYCHKCELNWDDTEEKCPKCGQEFEIKKEAKKVVVSEDLLQQEANYNKKGAFLDILGWAIIVIGILGTLYIATLDYEFNFVSFFVGALSSIILGGMIIGVGEIIHKLHDIEINTRKEDK